MEDNSVQPRPPESTPGRGVRGPVTAGTVIEPIGRRESLGLRNKPTSGDRITMPPRRIGKFTLRSVVAVAVIVAVCGVAIAASFFLFEQTVPGTTFPPPASVVTSVCSGALPASGFKGANTSDAWAVFSCSGDSTATQAAPAILLAYEGRTTATFTTPTGVWDVWLITNGGTPTSGCGSVTPGYNLTADPVVTVTSSNLGQTLNYCIDGAPNGSFVGFTVSWSEN